MKKILFRVTLVLCAALVSTLIVLGLTHAGHSSKGPIENAMSYTGDVVTSVEKKLIADQREDKREDKLQWLKAYKSNPKLLCNPGRMLIGAYDNEANESYQNIINLEDTLKTTFPLIHIYTAWGSKQEQKFPALQVKNITSLGSIPVITWEPWLNDFSPENYPDSRTPDEHNRNGLRDIADGKYDKYVAQWATEAAAAQTPVMLRFGHEMNDGYRYPWGPHNNTPQDFIAAWRHVHDLFIKNGAKNVVWVWGPHPAYAFDEFYPGADYVDYVGVGVLNYGSIAAWSKWWTFKEIFGNYYADLAAYGKPIIITEFGSLAVGGNRAAWYKDALDSLPQKYPQVKSIMFFHFSKDNTTTQQTLNWTIKNDHVVTNAIVKSIKSWK